MFRFESNFSTFNKQTIKKKHKLDLINNFQMPCGVSWVDNTLNKSFFKLGNFIGKNHGYFLIVPVLLALLCMTGWVAAIIHLLSTHLTNLLAKPFRFQQIKYEIDPEYLFSPISGEGKLERKIVENYFKVNYTHRFNVGRITRPGEKSTIIIDSATLS